MTHPHVEKLMEMIPWSSAADLDARHVIRSHLTTLVQVALAAEKFEGDYREWVWKHEVNKVGDMAKTMMELRSALAAWKEMNK